MSDAIRARAIERDGSLGSREAALRHRLRLVFERKNRAHAVPAPLAPLADTHTHLLGLDTGLAADALARAALAGERMLVTLLDPVDDGLDPQAFRTRLDEWIAQAKELLLEADRLGIDPVDGAEGSADRPLGEPAELLDRVGYLVGVHPYGATLVDDAMLRQMASALVDPHCLGIGEIGLDYHTDIADGVSAAPRGVQLEAFGRQLELARRAKLPVELHLRHEKDDDRKRSHMDAARTLLEIGVPESGCVVHCFTEDRSTMEQFVALGCFIAFGGAATFKRSEGIREAFAACPLNRILFETDAPYMAPEPVRGIPCEPAMIAFTADALVRDRSGRTGEDPRAIARAAWDNAVRLFG